MYTVEVVQIRTHNTKHKTQTKSHTAMESYRVGAAVGFVVRVVAVPLRRGLGVGADVLLGLGAVAVALLGLALVDLVRLLLRMLRPLNLMCLLSN